MVRDLPRVLWQNMKKSTELYPLFFCLGVGAVGSVCYLIRIAIKSPEVTWTPRTNEEPWNNYRNKRYKFMQMRDDLPTTSPAPEY